MGAYWDNASTPVAVLFVTDGAYLSNNLAGKSLNRWRFLLLISLWKLSSIADIVVVQHSVLENTSQLWR